MTCSQFNKFALSIFCVRYTNILRPLGYKGVGWAELFVLRMQSHIAVTICQDCKSVGPPIRLAVDRLSVGRLVV